MKTTKKVLITGASGFIGKHLMQALSQKDFEFLLIPHQQLTSPLYLEANIKEFQPDHIFHLAAYGNMANQKDEPEMLIANVNNLWNLLQATKDIPYKSFINVSTSSVTLPHQTIYSATKAGGEYLCRAFANEYKKPIVSVRPYSVYGEFEADFRFIPTVFRSCLAKELMQLSPNPTHDWVYVADFIHSIIEIAEQIEKRKDRQIFEIGTGKLISNLEVVHMVEKITGHSANYELVNKIRSFDTGNWVCRDPLVNPTSLFEGLKNYYGYYQQETKT